MILGRFLRKEESEGGRRARDGEGPLHKWVLSPRQEWGIIGGGKDRSAMSGKKQVVREDREICLLVARCVL